MLAWKIAGKEKDVRRTYGYKRAEIIAAFVNASALVAISLFLVFEAVQRFRKPETIDSGLMIGVALFGLVANFVSMRLLKKEAHGNMNVRSSYLHLLGDTVSSRRRPRRRHRHPHLGRFLDRSAGHGIDLALYHAAKAG